MIILKGKSFRKLARVIRRHLRPVHVVVDKRPVIGIQLELTTKCNTHCEFCPRDDLMASAKLRTIREMHKQGNYPEPCNRCDTWGPQIEDMEDFN